MPIDKTELKKIKKLKEANLELCEKLIQSMDDEKAYEMMELSKICEEIIETQLKPIYGRDIDILKEPMKIGTTIGALIGNGFLKQEETSQGKFIYKNYIQQEKLETSLNVLFKYNF